MSKLHLYLIFHLNLAYSSIPEEKISDVIRRCYWPLLKIAEKGNVKISVEASGYTLEKIQEIDPLWITKFKELIKQGKCEFIGSGYAQIIGPLVPARVNAENLRAGNDVYESILGERPSCAYVNEQAYSRSLVAHYVDAGYGAIVMEWNNPRLAHPEWPKESQYYAHRVIGSPGSRISVVWNNSVAFQKFQQYAYGEINLEEYLSYLYSHKGNVDRVFPLYGSDVEVFGFRPSRYKGEGEPDEDGEWGRIETLLARLSEDSEIVFIHPSGVQGVEAPFAQEAISLESPNQPIPVKKQAHYNITRWALTGRDNVKNNSKCYRLYRGICSLEDSLGRGRDCAALWKELCFLWGSDFRTHIEHRKYKRFIKRIDQMEYILKKHTSSIIANDTLDASVPKDDKKSWWKEENNRVTVRTNEVRIVLNAQRGLTVESLKFPNIFSSPIIGNIPHGYYDDISLSDDFMSGYTSIGIPMRPEMNDLGNVSNVRVVEEAAFIEVSGNLKIDAGEVWKKIRVYKNTPKIDYTFSFDLTSVSPASFRSGIFTFIPEAFNRDSLYYGCHNGGWDIEEFSLADAGNIIPTPISFLVSSGAALGNTEGELHVGDKDKKIIFTTDMGHVAGLPSLQFIDMPREKTFLLRVLYSLGEFNETSFLAEQRAGRKFSFTVGIEGASIEV